MSSMPTGRLQAQVLQLSVPKQLQLPQLLLHSASLLVWIQDPGSFGLKVDMFHTAGFLGLRRQSRSLRLENAGLLR